MYTMCYYVWNIYHTFGQESNMINGPYSYSTNMWWFAKILADFGGVIGLFVLFSANHSQGMIPNPKCLVMHTIEP